MKKKIFLSVGALFMLNACGGSSSTNTKQTNQNTKQGNIVKDIGTVWKTGKYLNDTNESKILSIDNARRLLVTIKGELEFKYDFIFIYDENGKVVAELSGDLKANKVDEELMINGSSITAKLLSDQQGTYSGVTISIKDPDKKINVAPTVSDIRISGNVQTGKTLTLNYKFNDSNGDNELNSIIVWSTKTKELQSGTSKTFVIPSGYEGKEIGAWVHPVDEHGLKGKGYAASNNHLHIKKPIVPKKPDTQKPKITLLGDEIVYLTVGSTYIDKGVKATDNIDGNVAGRVKITNLVDTNKVGTYSVTYNVGDDAGNKADKVERTVIVKKVPNHIPTVSNVRIIGTAQAGKTLTLNYKFDDPNDGDIEGKSIIAWSTKTKELQRGTSKTFLIPDGFKGTEIGAWVHPVDEHGAGNTTSNGYAAANNYIDVIVPDTQKPVITIVGNQTVNITVGDIYKDAGIQAKDNKDGNITSKVIIRTLVDTKKAGTYTITYNVSDTARNAADEVIRTVIVSEKVNHIPTVSLVNITGTAQIGKTLTLNYKFNDTDGDIEGNSIIVWSTKTNELQRGTGKSYTILAGLEGQKISVRVFPVDGRGVGNVSGEGYGASNNNLTIIAAPDGITPEITLNGISKITLTVGDIYKDAGAKAKDNKDGDITNKIITSGSVDATKAGTYTITYNVSDVAGNKANEVSRTVTVNAAPIVDTTRPVITLKGNSSITLTIGDTYTEEKATASDDKDGDITENISISGTVDGNTLGSYTITYNVADVAGNKADEITRTVVVAKVDLIAVKANIPIDSNIELGGEDGVLYYVDPRPEENGKNRGLRIDTKAWSFTELKVDGINPHSLDRAGNSDRFYIRTQNSDSFDVINFKEKTVKTVNLEVNGKKYKPRAIGATNLKYNLQLLSALTMPVIAVIDTKTDTVLGTLGDKNEFDKSKLTSNAGNLSATGHALWLDDDHFVLIDRVNKKVIVYKVEKDGDKFTLVETYRGSSETALHAIERVVTPLTKEDLITFYALGEGDIGKNITPYIRELKFDASTGKLIDGFKTYLDKSTAVIQGIKPTTHHAGISPDGKKLYVPVFDKKVYIIDRKTMKVTKIVEAKLGAAHVEFSKSLNIAVVTNHFDEHVTLIDIETEEVTANIIISDHGFDENSKHLLQPHFSYLSKDGKYFFTFDTQNGRFLKIDLEKREIDKELITGGAPEQAHS